MVFLIVISLVMTIMVIMSTLVFFAYIYGKRVGRSEIRSKYLSRKTLDRLLSIGGIDQGEL